MKRSTELLDEQGREIYEGDTVILSGIIEGKVVFCNGAFGIYSKNTIDYDYLCSEIAEWCGTENEEHFSWCDNFITFAEIMWNFGHEENSCPSVRKR